MMRKIILCLGHSSPLASACILRTRRFSSTVLCPGKVLEEPTFGSMKLLQVYPKIFNVSKSYVLLPYASSSLQALPSFILAQLMGCGCLSSLLWQCFLCACAN